MATKRYDTPPNAATVAELNPPPKKKEAPRIERRNAQFLYRDLCRKVVAERNAKIKR